MASPKSRRTDAGIQREFAATKLIREGRTIMIALTGQAGFGSPKTRKDFSKRRAAGVELITTAALAISLVIAATAVSIGMARAQVSSEVSYSHNSQ